MQINRIAVLAVLLIAAQGCAANEAAEPVASGPRVIGEPIEPRPEPVTEPELGLEERWRAPFAVQSVGRPASRPAPAAVAIESREPAAPAARQATADGAAERAATRDTTTTVAPVAAATRAPAAATPSPARAAATPPPAATPAPSAAPAAHSAPTRAAAPAAATPSSAGGTRTHRVEWGETWYGIARSYSIPPAALAAANPQADPERIRTGQVLRIPGADPARQPGQRSHVVRSGDSLWGIARQYGVTMEQVRRANRLPDDQVRLGQTLIIPPSEASR
jgi:peptidoglycan DL-endopeptidase LytF